MNSYLKKKKIIVSLTSIKQREDALQQTLESLMLQDIKFPYQIRLYLSHDPYLLDEGYKDTPPWITQAPKHNPNCSVKVCFVRNTGPYRKLIPILKECFEDPNAIIITCDDDTIYRKDWLSSLVSFNYLTGFLVGYTGHAVNINSVKKMIAPYKEWQTSAKDHFNLKNIPVGKDGILYHPSFFQKEVLDEDLAMELAPTCDDLWFRWHSLIRGVPCHIISLQRKVFSDASSSNNSESLWNKFNSQEKNDLSVKKLENYFLKRFGTNVCNTISRYEDYSLKETLPSLMTTRNIPLMAARQVRFINLCDNPNTKHICSKSYQFFSFKLNEKK